MLAGSVHPEAAYDLKREVIVDHCNHPGVAAVWLDCAIYSTLGKF